MQISNRSSINVPLDQLWDVLNDVERVAPFVPGFELQEAEGDTYRGTVKVKVGAVTVAYNAEIDVLERDHATRRVEMAVSGRERRGPGSMNAKVTSKLSPVADGTEISLTTDVQVTGRVAQFGSGVLSDVSASLLGQFVAALEEGLTAPPTPESDDTTAVADGSPGPSPRPSAENVIDITAAAGQAMLKRGAPQALGAILIAVVFYLLGRRH